MSKITSITSSDKWNAVLYDDGTAVLVRRILSSAGDNPLTNHEQMVEDFRETLAQTERERDEARSALDRIRKDIEGKDAALMRARVYGRDKDHRELAESLAKAERERDEARKDLAEAKQIIESQERDLVAQVYRGNSVGYWHTKAVAYGNAILEIHGILGAPIGVDARDAAGQVVRERDKAMAEVAILRHDPKADARQVIEEWRAKAERAWSDAGQAQERLDQATALLREAMSDLRYLNALPGEHGQDDGLVDRIDAFLVGQPAPAKVAVDDAMVERAASVLLARPLSRQLLRAALVAALEGMT